MPYRCLRTDYDIKRVYSFGENLDHPLMQTVDDLPMGLILQIRNFWQRHLTNPDECSFYDSFSRLLSHRRPKLRKNVLSLGETDAAFGSHWLGYYCKVPSHKLRGSLGLIAELAANM